MFKKKNENFLAVDLAPDAVRVLDVAAGGESPRIVSIAEGPLAEGGADTLPDRHLAALSTLLAAHRFRSRRCVAAVPTSLVTTRSVMIDPSKPQSSDEQIRATLQNILSYDARDLIFDFWKVSEPASNSRTFEALVVASRRSVVQKYLAGFQKLRLPCTHLDVPPCALAGVISRLLPDADAMAGTIALSGTAGYFAVIEKQRVLFWRPFELPGQNASPQTILARIGDEISKCVSHMVGSLHLDNMTDILFFGQQGSDDTFGAYLAERFNLQVRTPSPFECLPADSLPADVRTALQQSSATQFAVALGLALQRPGGLHG